MSDDVLLILVAVSQLAFGVYLGWLMWGRAKPRSSDNITYVDAETFERLLVCLDEPPNPMPRLKALLKHHPETLAPNPSNVRRRP